MQIKVRITYWDQPMSHQIQDSLEYDQRSEKIILLGICFKPSDSTSGQITEETTWKSLKVIILIKPKELKKILYHSNLTEEQITLITNCTLKTEWKCFPIGGDCSKITHSNLTKG